MAKNKKSKILAMALCASVMTGIYAAPVMADPVDKTQNITSETTAGETYFDGKVIADNFGITNGAFSVDRNGTIKGDFLIIGKNSADAVFMVDRDGAVKAANGAFIVDKNGNVTANSVTTTVDVVVGTYSLKDIGVKTQNMNATEGDTAFTGNVSATGTLKAGATTVDSLTVNGETTLKNTTVNGTLKVTDDTTLANTTVDGTLKVTGETTLENGATVQNGLTVTGDTTLENTTVNGTLKAGATTVDSLKSNGNVDVDGTLNVTDKTTLANTTVGGTLDVTGKTTLANTKVNGTLTAGETDVESLDVAKNATVGGTLGVTGKATFGSAENVTTIEGGTITTNTLNVETINLGNKILDKNGDDVYELSINANGSASFAKGDVTISEGGLTTFKDGDNTTTINGSEIVSDGGSLGETTINGGQVEIEQSLKVGDVFKVVGGNVWANNATIGGQLNVTGSVTTNGQLNVTGNVTTTGNVEAVDGKFSGDVDVNGVLRAANHEFEVNSDGDVKAADATFSGTLSAAGDKFNVNGEGKATFKNSGTGYTTIDGETITSYIDSGNNGILKGNTLTLYGAGGAVTTANAGSATFTKDLGGTTIIDGGTITTGTLNVENIVLGESMTDKAGSSITVGAAGVIDIEKDEDTVFRADTDKFEAHYAEYDLTLDGGNGFALSNETSKFTLKDNAFAFAGPVNLGASDDVSYVHNGDTIKLSDLTGRVEILEEKTTGISYNKDTGSTTITNTENLESSLTVGQDGTTFEGTGVGTTNINGGKVTVNGNDSTVTTIDGSEIVSNATASSTVTGGAGAGTGTVNGGYAEFDKGEGDKTIVDGGNVNVSNKITVGTGTTEITGDHVIVGVHDANKSNIGKGEATFDKGEDDKTIVNGGNVTTGNITADTGKIGNVEFTADGTTFEDGSENQTVIDKNGIVVGANDGTKIDKDDVSINDKNGGRIHLSDMGQVDNIDAELKQNDNYDDTVVGGINAEADIRRTEVARLDDRITKVEDRVDKVGAMSAAIANLRTMGYDPAAPTEIAVGVGQYRSETGVALGMFHYPNKDFMLSLSVSTSGDEVMGGIGATWKFGRKSPEKVLAAEKEKAAKAKLAKAEEMKKAAKEAKIKAQQERHAKLAAERAAQAEAAK